MTAVPAFTTLAALMVVAGMGISCMAALNGGLGVHLGSPAAAIDHVGLFGALRSELTPRRLAGIAVMAVGLCLARKPR